MRGQFYTYVHIRKTDGKVFYVGKGQGDRAFFMRNRNDHWNRVVAKHGVEVAIVAYFDTEAESFAHEISLVAAYRTIGAPLTNRTDGGEGASGMRHGPEARAKIAAAHLGATLTASVKAKIGEANRGRVRSAEAREKIVAGLTGRPVSAETRIKMSASQHGRVVSEDHRRKLSIANTGKKLSAETKAKIGAASRGHVCSDETRAKLSEVSKGRVFSAEWRQKIAMTKAGKKRLGDAAPVGRTL